MVFMLALRLFLANIDNLLILGRNQSFPDFFRKRQVSRARRARLWFMGVQVMR
jgi:hypothetical protein